MGKRRSRFGVSSFLLVGFLFLQLGLIAAQNPSRWLTLKGNAPAIIAKGGLSGLFPDSSSFAYGIVPIVSSNATTLWCDVRLTKDSIGICLPSLQLDNCTTIPSIYPQGQRTYSVNGVNVTGWFSVDYNMNNLTSVTLLQAIYSRTYRFNYNGFPINSVDAFRTQFNSNTLWLNIQHDMFYRQHNLSMTNYVLSITRNVTVDYISSPELVFLRGVATRFNNTRTKLIFRFLDQNMKEPSTSQTYGSLLNNNLTFIKTFASGILVPKNYISLVTADNYVQGYSTVVADAHKAGLEIYAADFVNDVVVCYNYSYDPLSEQLAFIDNGKFAVDGVVTDFPLTPSMAIGCFSQLNNSIVDHGKPLVISHNGASGDYPDCTDLAYQKAVDDGADIIDCPVQLTQDGTLICMSSVDLISCTTITKSAFSSRISLIPQLQKSAGIFTFNLTWDEIQKLKPIISQPLSQFNLVRNPRYKNSGSFMTLSNFLTFAKNKSVSGISIIIEKAAFMAQQLGFDAVDSVISAAEDAGYNKTAREVMIQSTDSAVLVKFKQLTKYRRVYEIDTAVRDAIASSVTDIKGFADAVVLEKESIYPTSKLLTTVETGLVDELHSAGLAVYASLFQNEFLSQAWDFYSDPTAEINTFILGGKVDGIITDYPATASRYKRNKCRNMGNNSPNYMRAFEAGQLLTLMAPDALPPALPPVPPLTDSDVVEPPLPPAGKAVAPASSPPKPSSGERCMASLSVPLTMMVCGFLLQVTASAMRLM